LLQNLILIIFNLKYQGESETSMAHHVRRQSFSILHLQMLGYLSEPLDQAYFSEIDIPQHWGREGILK